MLVVALLLVTFPASLYVSVPNSLLFSPLNNYMISSFLTSISFRVFSLDISIYLTDILYYVPNSHRFVKNTSPPSDPNPTTINPLVWAIHFGYDNNGGISTEGMAGNNRNHLYLKSKISLYSHLIFLIQM